MEHRAVECHSKICKGNYHSSLSKQSNTMMVATEGSVTYPVVVVK